jgi:predicted dithiol-disulfide oxidoreductase (DUF899 family)
MAAHKVVTHKKWLAARRKHLAKEKEFTRLRDQLSRERRELPWELVEKECVFEDESGRQTRAETFKRRSQLIIYHAVVCSAFLRTIYFFISTNRGSG